MRASVRVPTALTIAGSDSSGGAGIQADLKTFSALGVYGASAITALTAQNTTGVRAIHDVPADFVAAQIDAVFQDLEVGATKVGMLSRAATVRAVASRLNAHRAERVVLDPVMVAKSGATLLDAEAIDALRAELVPCADLLTPNLPEAAVLLGRAIGDVLAAPQRACEDLLALGARAVVLKGGHAGGAHSEDLFYDGSTWARLPARRIQSDNTHGTGCSFASAIAARLASGDPLDRAVQFAKFWLTEAIQASSAWKVGHGHGPIHHFYRIWPESTLSP